MKCKEQESDISVLFKVNKRTNVVTSTLEFFLFLFWYFERNIGDFYVFEESQNKNRKIKKRNPLLPRFSFCLHFIFWFHVVCLHFIFWHHVVCLYLVSIYTFFFVDSLWRWFLSLPCCRCPRASFVCFIIFSLASRFLFNFNNNKKNAMEYNTIPLSHYFLT